MLPMTTEPRKAQWEIRMQCRGVGMSTYGPPRGLAEAPQSMNEVLKTETAHPEGGVMVRVPYLCKIDGVEIKENEEQYRLYHPALDHAPE